MDETKRGKISIDQLREAGIRRGEIATADDAPPLDFGDLSQRAQSLRQRAEALKKEALA